MNVKLKVLTAAVMAGLVGTAAAAPIPGTPQPPIVPGGISPGTPGFGPDRLFIPEMAAYALLEGVAQAAEAAIAGAGSCVAAKNTFTLAVDTFANGSGTASVSAGGSPLLGLQVDLTAKRGMATGGYAFQITGDGSVTGSNQLSGVDIHDYEGKAAYDYYTGMMTLSSSMDVDFLLSSNSHPNHLEGLVIKDFKFVRGFPPVFIDYGYQAISKEAQGRDTKESMGPTAFPAAKYWQTSRSHRSDNVNGRTQMAKERVYSADTFNNPCSIIIDIQGSNTLATGVHQTGSLVIRPSRP